MCGEGRTFFLLIHRTSQSEVWSPFPYKGRLIGDDVCFVAVSYGEIVCFFGTSMAPSPTGGSGNAVRGVAVSYGERRTFSEDRRFPLQKMASANSFIEKLKDPSSVRRISAFLCLITVFSLRSCLRQGTYRQLSRRRVPYAKSLHYRRSCRDISSAEAENEQHRDS